MENTHSLVLNGTSQYAKILDSAQSGLDIVGDITLEGYFKWLSLPVAEVPVMIAKDDRYSDTVRGPLLLLVANKFNFIYFNGGVPTVGNTREEASTALSAGIVDTWVHFGATASVATQDVVLYVNGVAVGSSLLTSTASDIRNNTTPFHIGAGLNSGTPERYIEAIVNNIRVWNVVRTPAEMLANYQQVLTSGTGLVSSWFAQEDPNDMVGTNHLTLVNSPSYTTDVPFGESGANSTNFFQVF